MQKLKGLSRAVLESDEGREMRRLYDGLLAAMRQYEAAQFAEWCGLTAAVSEQKLRQPLLRWVTAGRRVMRPAAVWAVMGCQVDSAFAQSKTGTLPRLLTPLVRAPQERAGQGGRGGGAGVRQL